MTAKSDSETSAGSELRVRAVTLEAFRGVPGTLRVEFAGKSRTPVSAIVFGENGSGKSSIVDAVEWACQGKVGRVRPRTSTGGPRVINVSSPSGSCEVTAELSDGTVLTRRLEPDSTAVLRGSGSPIPEALTGRLCH